MKKNLKVVILAVGFVLIVYGLFLSKSEFWWCVGNIYERTHQPNIAACCFNKAIEINPDYKEAYFYVRFKDDGNDLVGYMGGLANCYLALGQFDNARTVYLKALHLPSRSMDRSGSEMLINAQLRFLSDMKND